MFRHVSKWGGVHDVRHLCLDGRWLQVTVKTGSCELMLPAQEEDDTTADNDKATVEYDVWRAVPEFFYFRVAAVNMVGTSQYSIANQGQSVQCTHARTHTRLLACTRACVHANVCTGADHGCA